MQEAFAMEGHFEDEDLAYRLRKKESLSGNCLSPLSTGRTTEGPFERNSDKLAAGSHAGFVE